MLTTPNMSSSKSFRAAEEDRPGWAVKVDKLQGMILQKEARDPLFQDVVTQLQDIERLMARLEKTKD